MRSFGWFRRARGGARGVWRARIAAVLLLAFCLPPLAAAARAEPPRREPGRYALVVGNGGYNTFGAMGDLLTACDEAVRFRQRLLDLGWARDHLHPLVKASAGGETDADVRSTICDLKTESLRTALRTFSNVMIEADDNPFGVVYFSGHGAQSDGNQYVFGVDADVDFGTELLRASRAPNYKVFEDSGVDLISIVGRVSRSEGRAMLVIVDACRDNPVLNKYREDVQKAKATSGDPALVERLSAGYLSRDGQSEDVTDDFNNIIVLFSTRPKREAAGASPGQVTQFSQYVMKQMTDARALGGNVPGFVDGVRADAVTKQAGLPTWDRQLPDRLGAMAPSPVFCFKGCPQPLDVWPSTRIRVIGASATSMSAPPAPARLAARPVGAPVLRRAAYFVGSGQTGPASGPSPSVALRVPLAPLALPPRSIKVDVFYCQGDALAAKREADATAYAEALYAAYPPKRLIGRYYIDPIRTVSFDPVAKPVIATGKFGTTIWIDAGSPLEHEWADRLAAVGGARGGGVRIVENRWTKSKEYLSVFFCQDRAPDAVPVSTVYTQVSRAADVPRARALIDSLKAQVEGLTFITAVDPVDEKDPSRTRVPQRSEVRYYSDDQRLSAQAIASALGTRLTSPPVVKKIALNRKSANPVIEVWIGLNETRGWRAVPG